MIPVLSVHVRMPAPRKRCEKNGTGTGRGGQAEEIIKQKTCLKAIKLKSRFHASITVIIVLLRQRFAASMCS